MFQIGSGVAQTETSVAPSRWVFWVSLLCVILNPQLKILVLFLCLSLNWTHIILFKFNPLLYSLRNNIVIIKAIEGEEEEEEEECRIRDLGRVQDPPHLPNPDPLSASTTLFLALPLLLLSQPLQDPGTSNLFFYIFFTFFFNYYYYLCAIGNLNQ